MKKKNIVWEQTEQGLGVLLSSKVELPAIVIYKANRNRRKINIELTEYYKLKDESILEITGGENKIEAEDTEKISAFEDRMKEIINIETEVDIEKLSIEQLEGKYPAWVISVLDFMFE